MSTDRGTQTNKRHKDEVTQTSTAEGGSENKEENANENSEDQPNRDYAPRNTTTTLSMGLSSNETVFSCQFEVFGIVQGVSFRMYTLRRAEKLGIRGWCQNTKTNSVKGEIEGHYNPFEEMRLWLKYTGSPTSRIDKVVFSDTIERPNFSFQNFSILMD